jgi:excisionase family DNA binding protein
MSTAFERLLALLHSTPAGKITDQRHREIENLLSQARAESPPEPNPTAVAADFVPSCLSVPALAAYWGVSERHVRNLVERGELPCIRVGRVYRIRRRDIEAYEAREWRPEPAMEEPKTDAAGTPKPDIIAREEAAIAEFRAQREAKKRRKRFGF